MDYIKIIYQGKVMKTNVVILGGMGAAKSSLIADLFRDDRPVSRLTIDDCAEVAIPEIPIYNACIMIVQESKELKDE